MSNLLMQSIKQILVESQENGVEKLAAEVWLGYLLGENSAWLFAHQDEPIDHNITEKFYLGMREILNGRPVAQLIGLKEFYGLPFIIDENVLIPRPESELLVDLTKKFIQKKYPTDQVTVADIGTGSGCILLTILKEIPTTLGIGIEVSDQALQIAQKNAVSLGLEKRVKLIQGNLLEPLEQQCEIIVTNLPYIGRDKFHFIADNVARYEPEVALFGGSDGLDLYREMFEQLKQKSWSPALLIGEFGFGQEELMREILQKYFADQKFEIIPDLAGIPRVFVVNFALNGARN